MRAHAFLGAVYVGGAIAFAVALARVGTQLDTTLALLAAAAIVGEFFEVRGEVDGFEASGSHSFSFSSGVHIAAIVLLGPLGAVLVAVVGVVAVDCLRRPQLRMLGFNASAFALSTLAGGAAYVSLGGVAGTRSLPGDLLPLAAMTVVYVASNRLLVVAVVALTSRNSFLQLVGEAWRTERASALAEVALGVALAYFVISDPWQIVVLCPLVFAVYQAHVRLGRLHRETARALETFANVIDERDPYTYQHSMRVVALE